ncbi:MULTISPECIES: hypothetical protein [unclassified Sphingomonas]|uniref:hypothetical protein n=1 Tax=Novosphingobium rhizosphaerae TaxID=1551649 RepID=UPI0015CD4F2B
MTKTKRKAGARHKPITAHRLFPAFAALWFAALFGLASFAVPVDLLQRVVVASGLPHLVAAAAPPLGFTARALVALLLTGVGGMLGLLIGLRLGARHRPMADPAESDLEIAAPVVVATAPRVRARDAHPDAPPRRPLVVSADMIDESETTIVADDSALALRRRPLVTQNGPSAPQAIDPVEDLLPGGSDFARDAFDPFAIYEGTAESAEPFVPPAFLAEALGEAAREDIVPLPKAAPETVAETVPEAEPGPGPGPEQAADTANSVSPAVEPEPVLPEAVDEASDARPAEETDEAEEPARVTVPAGPSLFAMARQAVGEGGRSPVAQADLDGLGLVQLVERLALAIADHRRALDNAVEDSASAYHLTSRAPTGFDSGDEAGTPVVDAARGHAPGDVLAMPRLHRVGPADTGLAGEPTGEAAVLEQRYSSLLDMAAAVRRADSIRHALSGSPAATPQPVVIFPGQARAQRIDEQGAAAPLAAPFERPYLAAVPSRFQAFDGSETTAAPDAESTEQALRDALATLQRMTANR